MALPTTPRLATLGAGVLAVSVLALGPMLAARAASGTASVEVATSDFGSEGDAALAPAELALARGSDLAPCPIARRDPRPSAPPALASSAFVEPDDEVLECGCALEECPIRIEYLDAITARELEVGPLLTEEKDPTRRVELPQPFWGRAGWRPAAKVGGARERLFRASAMTLPILVPAPYLAWRRFEPATLSDRAKSFHAVVPLDHEVDVRLRILDEDARADRDAIVAYWTLADTVVSTPAVEPLSDGSFRLRGVPWLPGESLRLGLRSHAARGAAPDARDAEAPSNPPAQLVLAPVDDARIFATTISMPDSPYEPIARDIEPAWEPPPNVFKGRAGHRNLRAGGGCRRGPTERGDVRLVVLDSRRRPIPDLRVSVAGVIALTDADGVVRLRHVLDHSRVEVSDVGYRFDSKVVFVDPGREVEVELVEAPAGTLEVTVVDGDGRAVPSATVAVEPSGFGWFDVDEQGVQRLDRFTDVLGRRTCHDVPCGPTTVRASYGGRRGEATVEVGAGGRSVVRIVVR